MRDERGAHRWLGAHQTHEYELVLGVDLLHGPNIERCWLALFVQVHVFISRIRLRLAAKSDKAEGRDERSAKHPAQLSTEARARQAQSLLLSKNGGLLDAAPRLSFNGIPRLGSF